MSKFRFNEKEHYYELKVGDEWKPLTGTTQLIKEILPPPLVWWGAGMALENLGWLNPKKASEEERIKKAEETLKKLQKLTPKEYESLLQKCYRYHDEYKTQRADRGTDIHKLVEEAVKEAIKSNNGYLKKKYENEFVNEFAKWGKGKKFLGSEVQVYSEKMFLGGTIDLVYEEGKRYYLGDIKTSKDFHPSQIIQMSLYDYQQKENGFYNSDGKQIGKPKKIHGYTVVNLDKKVIAKTYYAVDEMREFAENLVELYRRKQKLENFLKQ